MKDTVKGLGLYLAFLLPLCAIAIGSYLSLEQTFVRHEDYGHLADQATTLMATLAKERAIHAKEMQAMYQNAEDERTLLAQWEREATETMKRWVVIKRLLED